MSDGPVVVGPDERHLAFYMHNGFSSGFTGNTKAIDVLKELLIPNREVKGIAIYGETPLRKLESLNYTQLKELRGK